MLRSLDLSGTRISDLAPLATLTRLEYLDLTGAPVTDLSPLAALVELRRLDLRSTRADPSVLAHLARCQIITTASRPRRRGAR
jgi:Leucine-rich repeat (LRR) protein